jgi:hypothetical protein
MSTRAARAPSVPATSENVRPFVPQLLRVQPAGSPFDPSASSDGFWIRFVGAGVVPLATVNVTAAEVRVFPAASRATAVRLWLPLASAVVFSGSWNGAAVTSAPTWVPSTRNLTPTTPTLSLAWTDRVVVPDTVAPAAGAVADTVGGVVSATVKLTAAEVVALPAASRAVAVTVWLPTVRPSMLNDT